MNAEERAVRVVGADRWADAGAWTGEGMVREVFFFCSAGSELYGSIYAAEEPRVPVGVVICNSWGYEANLAGRIVHPVSIAVAQAGGIAVNFHYPGFGDSGGDFSTTTVQAQADAAVDALGEASRRHPGARWILAGLVLGASVAALAAERGAGAESLLLVQPALRPSAYFAHLERAARRSLPPPAPKPAPGFAFGYPLGRAPLEAADAADAAVEVALRRFAGEGTVVSYEKPEEIDGVPERFERIRAPGSWRFGIRNTPELTAAVADCLVERLAEEA